MVSAARGWWARAVHVVALVCGIALLTTACAGASTTDSVDEVERVVTAAPLPTATAAPPLPTATAAPTATAEAPVPTVPAVRTINPSEWDGERLRALADQVDVEEGTFLIALLEADGTSVTGSKGTDSSGNAPTVDDLFYIGSYTKVFTAIAILTLVDDGVVDLDAPAVNYVTRVPLPVDVTVRDLLQHTSGIYNFTDSVEYRIAALATQGLVWTPEETFEYAIDEPSRSSPGLVFDYSNTNYLILGLLIEETTGQPYHEVVRERIIDPLGLSSTYLGGFEEGPDVFDPSWDFIGGDDGALTSFWAGGSMVSSAPDLHALNTALFGEQIISAQLVDQMTSGAQLGAASSLYGLGLMLDFPDDSFYGHNGGLPGYGTVVRHSPASGVTAFLMSTDSRIARSLDADSLSDFDKVHWTQLYEVMIMLIWS